MEIYLFVFFLTFLGIFISEKENVICLYFYIAVLTLFFISSLRDVMIGKDFGTYINIFYTNNFYFKEKLFTAFIKTVSKVSTQPFWYATCINLLLFIPLVIYIKENVDYKDWMLVLFIFVANPYLYVQTTFNILRQCCATGIVLMGIMLLKRDNFLSIIGYILVVLLASEFHRSVLVAILIVPVDLFGWTKKKWMFVATASFALYFFLTPSLVAEVAGLIGFQNYASYEASVLDHPLYVLIIYLYTVLLISSYDEFEKDKKQKFFVDVYLFSLCFLMFAVRNDAIYRVRLFFVFISLPVLPYIFKNLTTRNFTRYICGLEVEFNGDIIRLHYVYYFVFYIGYISLLAINHNPYYVPFKFCFQ